MKSGVSLVLDVLEVVYYARFESGYESYPAENYVDYMTNVMPVPERHLFLIPNRGIVILCEAKQDSEGERVLEWSTKNNQFEPSHVQKIEVDREKLEETLASLSDIPRKCAICEKNLGQFLKLFNGTP